VFIYIAFLVFGTISFETLKNGFHQWIQIKAEHLYIMKIGSHNMQHVTILQSLFL